YWLSVAIWQFLCRQFLLCCFVTPINCTPSVSCACAIYCCSLWFVRYIFVNIVYGLVTDSWCVQKTENIVTAHRVELGVVTAVGVAVDMGAYMHETLNKRADSRGCFTDEKTLLPMSVCRLGTLERAVQRTGIE
ncbi:unnamed protein product, partial [Ectocarpus sp. 8 AP-2014]